MTDDAKKMKEVLWSQPLIPTFIPCEGKEKPGVAEETVQINGYKLTIKKGVMVMLPEQVTKMLWNHLNINQGNVGMDKRLDRDQKTLEALA